MALYLEAGLQLAVTYGLFMWKLWAEDGSRTAGPGLW